MRASGCIDNSREFLTAPGTYFTGSYEQFTAFGGPCVYFHRECLRAGNTAFLSLRHLELLYATLTAWGMHRPGPTGAKLTSWKQFSLSIRRSGSAITDLRRLRMARMSKEEYFNAMNALKPIYEALELTESGATVVANSKALYHLLPDLVPPIDRQHTIRFFTQTPARWRSAKGSWSTITLPTELRAQFELFRRTCAGIKRLADNVRPNLLADQERDGEVSVPKALDNAIVNYIRMVDEKNRLGSHSGGGVSLSAGSGACELRAFYGRRYSIRIIICPAR